MIYFPFCIHNHQPVGNFTSVLEDAYQDSYWPFLKALSKHPKVKLSFHNSGFLLDWLIENHPEFIGLMRSMVDAGQIEVMGGGYYEPILTVISETDRHQQITMMSDRIEETFGKRPRGIWLAERVWEPSLPTLLKNAGIEYVLVDDYHFIKAGLKREDLGGYFITEDQGNVLKVFPGNERLRYLIPFEPVEKLEDYLKNIKNEFRKGSAGIYGDDGEKFGVWPGTRSWVFDEGWLERFFEKIESLDWLKPVTLAEYIDSEEPLGRVYLPTTSYMEMGEWALPAESSEAFTSLVKEVKSWPEGERIYRFLQGGIWRNFFTKYPESNWMHKRMLLVSREMRLLIEGRLGTGEDELKEAARSLFRAQCNDAYWHGVFGGLYLPHLRTSLYENLIKAENMAKSSKVFDDAGFHAEKFDMDADDHEELIVRTRDLNLFFSPRLGGALFEADHKPTAVNVSNTLSRWEEGYHAKIKEKHGENGPVEARSIHELTRMKEKGLERFLRFDSYRRGSFIDRFLRHDETIDNFSEGRFTDLGDFHNNGYETAVSADGIVLKRSGYVNGSKASVTKTITDIKADSFRISYSIDGVPDISSQGLRFGVEMNFLLPCCNGPACKYVFSPCLTDDIGLGSFGELAGIKEAALLDMYTGVMVSMKASGPLTLWRFPVYTISLSESGFERIFQGSCLVFLARLADAGRMAEFSFDIKINSIPKSF